MVSFLFRLGMTLLGIGALLLFQSMALREQYLKANLAPFGSSFVVKDLAAYAMTSFPKAIRILKTGQNVYDVRNDAALHAEMEGFHTSSTNVGMLMPNDLVKSPYFAENFYFWMSDATQSTDFLVTTRLSFYGVNASEIIPWFTFQLQGEEWNLPQDFSPDKYVLGSKRREAVDSAHGGRLHFDNPVPMKAWVLSYKGWVENRNRDERRWVEAEFDLTFSDANVFSYQAHWDEMATALSLANKTWDASFFRNLRAQNQQRYASQATAGKGFVQFKGMERHEFSNLMASRDHLWGIRKWVFMSRYIWWPPLALRTPLVLEGVKYTSFIGAFVEYGNTMSNMVVGGLVSDIGQVASFSGATHMKDIAPTWYEEPPTGEFIGERLLPGEMTLHIGLLQATHVLTVHVKRGRPVNKWSHTFSLAQGAFEIHEALTDFSFSVSKNTHPSVVLSSCSATGLFEFGATVIKPEQDE